MNPSKKPTFVDSSVLINAIAGRDAARKMRALAILGDRGREFVATRFLILEVSPIPVKYLRKREAAFYDRYFQQVAIWIDEAPLIQPAIDLASQFGLGALDALHLAAAISAGAEFISAERPTKPIYRAYRDISSIH